MCTEEIDASRSRLTRRQNESNLFEHKLNVIDFLALMTELKMTIDRTFLCGKISFGSNSRDFN